MTADWDARTYHRVSGPQLSWAAAILDRLDLQGDETVLDAGCGSGRVTLALLDRLPRGHVVAVDGAPSMVAEARELLGDRATVLQSDLVELELDEPVDAIFSNAVFHWIPDHPALFAALRRALKPGGRIAAQCGGFGNIDRFRTISGEIAAREPYAEHFEGWSPPWNYAEPDVTEARLRAAGFTDVRAWLEPRPATPDEPAEYLRSICLFPHLEQLPATLHEPYLQDVLDALGDPLVLDYVRLNIDAT